MKQQYCGDGRAIAGGALSPSRDAVAAGDRKRGRQRLDGARKLSLALYMGENLPSVAGCLSWHFNGHLVMPVGA
ncbi:MAG: hypothetical protein M1299_03830 [Firmicutes bacterium]|nr:hypothetical protein [Bacillota bacterium]MCL5038946.1 hypothetical protein [Bacillota bacterium]